MTRCKNGHEQSEENVYYSNDRMRGLRRRCRLCRNSHYTPNGKPSIQAVRERERNYRMEDIADLIELGATFEEIVERGPYANWISLNRALNKYGRTDLQEKLRNLRNPESETHLFAGIRLSETFSRKLEVLD